LGITTGVRDVVVDTGVVVVAQSVVLAELIVVVAILATSYLGYGLDSLCYRVVCEVFVAALFLFFCV
jgi:hypothetical protein